MFDREEGEEARRAARAEIRERADRLHAGDWVGGRLLKHGKAPYQHEAGNSDSYYVRLQTTHGTVDLWGTDLERAVGESRSRPKVGDAVGVRITGREPLDNGKTWNRWQVETAMFIVQQKRIAREILENPITARRSGKEHPEITGSYLVIWGAELLAKHRYSSEERRREFVAGVREAIGLTRKPLQATPSPAAHDPPDHTREQNLSQRPPQREAPVRE
jgi:hypothetical protein